MRSAVQLILGLFICVTALVLPYRARVAYYQVVGFTIHFPVILFAKLVRKMLSSLQSGGKN